MMEKIVCHSKAITKGFEFRWTIDQQPGVLSFAQHLKSPVFKALSWNWAIKTRYLPQLVYWGRRGGDGNKEDYFLSFSLNLVDANGREVDVDPTESLFDEENIAEVPADPLFDETVIHAKVSLRGGDGTILLPETVLVSGGSLRKMINKQFGKINFTKERELISKFNRIQMLFELRIHGKHERVLTTERSLDTLENSAAVSMKKMNEDGKFTDFSIRTGDGREIRAHRVVLNATSTYFEALFNSGGIEAQRGEIEVPEPFPVMNELVRFLYTGEFPPVENMGYGTVMGVFVAADKYQITKLKSHLEGAVDALFTTENVYGELVQAHARGNKCLMEKAVDFIRAHRHQMEESGGWRAFCRDHADIVFSILAQ